jgi:hypothetical protein
MKRRENNIKMDITEINYKDMNWIQVAQDYLRLRTLVLVALNVSVLST